MIRHAILAAIGTDGDIHPCLGLGIVLRARGWRVTLATHEHFAPLAAQSSLEFRQLVSNEAADEALSQPDFWHPLKGPLLLARWGTRLLRGQYEILSDLASTGGKPLLIAGTGVIAARLVQEKLGVPLASLILQPWVVTSVHTPPVIMGGLSLPSWSPRFATRAYIALLELAGLILIGPELRRLRASLDLPPVRRIFQWWLSPHLVLGMFPEWYGPPQPDWPPQLKLTGFPVTDGQPTADLPEDLHAFCAAGPPPIAFTFGTGMMHAAALFQECATACQRLGARAIFLTKFRSQLPAELPPSIIHCPFAPFQKLFPLCATVVHHGGIGTTAKALAAGVPQLILPFAFDQLDNAQRVKKLGAGDWLPPRKRHTAALATTLTQLVTPEAATRSRSISARFHDTDGLKAAADTLEHHWPSSPQSS